MFQRSFTSDSWWNRPATGVPLHPDSDKLTKQQQSLEDGRGFRVAVGDWAIPFSDAPHEGTLRVFRASKTGDTVAVHAVPVSEMTGNDKAAVFRCLGCDKEVSLFEWDGKNTCTNFGLYTPSSSGIAGTPKNDGHRGIPPSAMMVSLRELVDGVISHRLKVSLSPPGKPPGNKAIWPLNGFENRSGVIPEGAVLRLKQSAFERVNPQGVARVIATAALTYGFVVGDTGGTAALKMEKASSYPVGVKTALDAFSLTDYEVLQYGWGK